MDAHKQIKPVERIGLNLREACTATSLGRNTVLGLIHSGKLKHIRVGRRIVIPEWAIEEFLGEGQ